MRDNNLVFASKTGTELDASPAGLDATASAPLLSDEGVPIEQIARLVGHAGGSSVTETVYRKQLRPIIDDGATVMNRVFPIGSGSHSPRLRINERPVGDTGIEPVTSSV